jgi:hypothetical protein
MDYKVNVMLYTQKNGYSSVTRGICKLYNDWIKQVKIYCIR